MNERSAPKGAPQASRQAKAHRQSTTPPVRERASAALDRLAAALDAVGHAYRRTDEGLAVDATPELVGELAAAHRIVLHSLVGTVNLEQAFFRLIQESDLPDRPASAEVHP